MTTNLELNIAFHHGKCAGAIKMLPLGEWSNEKHRLEFKHAGLDCLMSRSSEMLFWCGYVAVKPDHPLFEKHYDDEKAQNIEAHGGLTYAGACGTVICHKTEDPEDKAWWFGFDCAHCYDFMPATYALSMWYEGKNLDRAQTEHYWTQAEVMEETKKLAEQLRDIGVKDKV